MHDCEQKIYPQNLHLQFHGREIHSVCFIIGDLECNSNTEHGSVSESCWIGTGCEDGSVRLTRYDIYILGFRSLVWIYMFGSLKLMVCNQLFHLTCIFHGTTYFKVWNMYSGITPALEVGPLLNCSGSMLVDQL